MRFIIYSALTVDDDQIERICPSVQAALDLARADIEHGLVPVVIRFNRRRLGIETILSLLEHEPLAERTHGSAQHSPVRGRPSSPLLTGTRENLS